jgi:hypothetical protein
MTSLDTSIALQCIPNTKPQYVEDGTRQVLESVEGDHAMQSNNGSIHEFSLPRADGGKQAWFFLAGCFFVEALVWGESMNQLFFQRYDLMPTNCLTSSFPLLNTHSYPKPSVFTGIQRCILRPKCAHFKC